MALWYMGVVILVRNINGKSNIMNKSLSSQDIKAICDILADTSAGLSKSEIHDILHHANIAAADDGCRNNGLTYTTGLNKRDWLYNCLVQKPQEIQNNVLTFIKLALSPIRYTPKESRTKYERLLEGVNKVLMLLGLTVTKKGTIEDVAQATSLDEVDERVNHLKRQLTMRGIHSEVSRFCARDILREDYFSIVFESAKGLAERVREITGLTTDGGELFQCAFSSKNPQLFFNTMRTESEKSEFQGLKELLEAIFHLVRNPAAHTPKINWKKEETNVLDVLSLISFAHKYLDECHKMPKAHQ